MRFSRLMVCAAFVIVPVGVSAQAPANTPPAASVTATGPRLENARLGIAPATVEAESSELALAEPRLGQSMALMIVGGAALVAGLIIGGDAGTVVALGGAVIGLVGLYQYLR